MTLPTHETPGRTRGPRRRFVVTVVAVPVLVVAAGMAVALASRSQLPAVVASHWGPNGVDATQSVDAYLGSSALAVLGVAALLGGAGWFTPPDGRRWLATLVAALAGLLGTLVYGLLLLQRGVTDPSTATAPGGVFVVGALAGAGLGGLAWAVNPVDPVDPVTPWRAGDRPTLPGHAPVLATSPGERVAWVGHTAAPRWLGWVCVALVALACFCAVVASPWAALGPALGIVLVVLVMRAVVVVDQHGLRVTSAGVLTWLTLPLDQVAHAEPSSLTAFREFGGLGMRYRPDARAFVTRTGEALRVTQPDGSRTYVSMDDADQAAAVLNTLARRTRVP